MLRPQGKKLRIARGSALSFALVAMGFCGPRAQGADTHAEGAAGQAQRCAATFDDIPVVNRNGTKPLDLYPNPNARPLREYGRLFGQRFRNRAGADEPLRFLDVGSGFGVAGLQLSALGDHRVTVINSQDLWGPLLAWQPNQPIPLSDAHLERLVARLGITHEEMTEYSPYDDQPKRPAHWRELLLPRLQMRVQAQIAAGKFTPLTGFAEQVLPTLADESYDQIADAFGAYYFSGGRMELVDQYAKKLAPGGEAFVIYESTDHFFSRPSHVHGPQSTVFLRGGRDTVLLEQFLAQRFPSNFEIFRTGNEGFNSSEHKVLALRRGSGAMPRLRDSLQTVRHFFPTHRDPFNNDLPSVIYRER